MSALRFLGEFYGAVALQAVLRWTPLPLLRLAAWPLGSAVAMLGLRRRVFAENLAIALPELSSQQRRRLRWECSRHFARVLLSYLHWAGRPPQALAAHSRSIGCEAMQQALDEGRGVLMVSGHLGHWEVMAGRVVLDGFPFRILVGTLKNHLLDAYLTRLRRLWGFEPIPRGMAAREMLRTLRGGGIVGVLFDQDARAHGIFSPFFGRQCSTFGGPALFALRTRAAVVFCHSVIERDGSVTVNYERVPVEEQWYTDQEQGMKELTNRFNTTLERLVRSHPEQYFWFHRRFKTPPPPG